MDREMIAKTEAFLKETFAASTYLQANPTERDYRLEHSYWVANIAKQIAEAEELLKKTFALLKILQQKKITKPMDSPSVCTTMSMIKMPHQIN